MNKLIVGTGSYLPNWEISNDDLEKIGVGYDRARSGKTLDEWAMERMGVHTRHRIQQGEGISDMATHAAQNALDDGELQAGDLDLIVLSTFASDYRMPNSAALVQGNLGCRCKSIQLDAVCIGFVDATITAAALLDFMDVEYALVISGDATSQIADPDNFMMQCLLGDGAGAIILRNSKNSVYGLRNFYTDGDATGNEVLWVPGGGTKELATAKMLTDKRQYLIWDYQKVYSFAVQKLVDSTNMVAHRAGWNLNDVDWFIPHQAGRNIILDAARLMKQPIEKFIINIDHTGNCAGAAIPIALDEANRAGKFTDGNKIIMPAVGAGLAWGALAFVWQEYKKMHQS